VGDLNVRNIPEDVMKRLREQAGAEGLSLSEWVRVTLADRAELPTTAELSQRRGKRSTAAQSSEDFAAFYRRRLHRRSS
jgi:plasmid stability protein